jgi:methionine synthase II (cobalamin-independent)
MFDSLFGIVSDVAKTVSAPVKIAADLTRAVTKPIADAAEDCAKAVEDEIRDLTDD